jgi:hypothetical protein
MSNAERLMFLKAFPVDGDSGSVCVCVYSG